MDITEIFSKIGFDFRIFLFNLFNFIIIGLLIYKFVFKKISSIIEERNKVINEGIERYKKSDEILQIAKIDAEKIILESKLEAKKIIDSATENAKKISEEIINDAKAKSASIIEKSKLQAEKIQEEYMQKLRESLSEIVIKASKIVIERDLCISKQEVEKILKENIL